jgi:VanZ family protein
MTIFRADLRHSWVWLICFLVLLLSALGIALLPINLGGDPKGIHIIDKLGHMFAFMGLMIGFGGIFTPAARPYLFVFLLGWGGLIEYLQMGIPSRSAEAADIAANLTGLLIGWYLLTNRVGDWCVRVERRLGPE